MMGLFTYAVTGGAFILIGAWESIISASEVLVESSSSASSSQSSPSPLQGTTTKTTTFSSTITFFSISVLSILVIVNSLISLFDAIKFRDNTGFALQFEVITISLLFLLYSGLGILTNVGDSFRFPLVVLNLICAFAFGEEFFLFYSRSKDPSGIENRYYDLFLVPIAICVFSTIIELKNPDSNYPRLGRGIGLVLQGMWVLQMGFSFHTNLIANGCALHANSRGNYTIKCKGHPEYHRGRAIATLQFNCHLAFLVTLLVAVYSFICKKNGVSREFMQYKPLGDGGEMHMDGRSQFTLDSDDEDSNGEIIKEAKNVEMQKAIGANSESAVNDHQLHS
ncbi:uncharacterized protein LOC142537091 [Primulina tabacum]|uniref:uncharacterized protein LOC142537091 n=1 Tax=Primulina tabacum TaxID=48773 RepID=UPI003F5A6459